MAADLMKELDRLRPIEEKFHKESKARRLRHKGGTLKLMPMVANLRQWQREREADERIEGAWADGPQGLFDDGTRGEPATGLD